MSVLNQDKEKFFIYYPLFLFLFVLVIFPLKAIFAPEQLPPIKPIHHAHAITMGLWFALAAMQPWLIKFDRRNLHRTFGWLSIGVIASWVIVCIPVTYMNWHRMGNPQIVMVNIVNTILFLAYFCAAITCRRLTDYHKRFMLAASITLMGPAAGRVAEILQKPPETAAPVMVVMILAPLVYDLIARKRPHPATLVFVVVAFTSIPIFLTAAENPVWVEFVTATLGKPGN